VKTLVFRRTKGFGDEEASAESSLEGKSGGNRRGTSIWRYVFQVGSALLTVFQKGLNTSFNPSHPGGSLRAD